MPLFICKIGSADGRIVEKEFEAVSSDVLKQNLTAQVSGSVRWTQSVQTMMALGVTQYIECGHGQVLKGLIKKIDESASTHSLQSTDDLVKLEQFFQTATGQ